MAQARRYGDFPDLIDTLREVHVPRAWTGADAAIVDRLTFGGNTIGTGTDSYRLAHSKTQQGSG